MDITPAITDGRKLIEAYGIGRFRISGVLYEHGVLLQGDAVYPLQVQRLEDLTFESFAPLLVEKPSLILLGTGAKQYFPSKELKAALRAEDITLEAMASDAACRTYNVLLAEGRPVAAALLTL